MGKAVKHWLTKTTITDLEQINEEADEQLAYARITERRRKAMIKRIRKANAQVTHRG